MTYLYAPVWVRTTVARLSMLTLPLACSAGNESGENGSVQVFGGDPGGPSGNSENPSGDAVQPNTGEPIVIDGVIGGAQRAVPPGCGDGILADDEGCDDGNHDPGDGCSPDCLTTEPGFSCAMPGKPCQPIARCGDGLVAPSEQCDDANAFLGDGCSERCRVEIGKKCVGEPSVCTDTTCGDSTREGAEACDDGNANPFDGCSSLCLREPNCDGLSCTSECGDGLVINEGCDDGNTVDGDGCSSSCEPEPGFTCQRSTACEMVSGECALRVPAIFRDFSSHPDFLPPNTIMAARLLRGIVEPALDNSGRPTLSPNGPSDEAYIDSADSFAQWYRDGSHAQTHVGELVLFDNTRGGYVNRLDEKGTFFTSTGGPNETHYPGGETIEACASSCRTYVANEDFNAGCSNFCNSATGAAQRARDELRQADDRLTQAIQQYGAQSDETAGTEPTQITAAREDVVEAETVLERAETEAEACNAQCEDGIGAMSAVCAATCLPCSDSPDQYCTGGEVVEWEGAPLFFPVDALAGNLGACSEQAPEGCAKVPAQYGYLGWPFEHDIFPGASQHNFHFTSEVQYWFQYDAGTNATLDFTGDDDVWVFLNGKLALDIGGVHVPISGSVTIDAAAGTVTTQVIEPGSATDDPPLAVYEDRLTATDFGFEVGSVYKITVFHAERQPEGSSFKLTLSGFEATPSDCRPMCGDGVLSFGEECDLGTAANVGGYGGCNTNCTLGEFCGDGRVNGPEHCDPGPGGDPTCPASCRIVTSRVR